MRVPRGRGYIVPGSSPYHSRCVEGLASGADKGERAGMSGGDKPADHPSWPQAADALAALCHELMLTTLPQRILIGGGVAAGQPQLFPLLRARLAASKIGRASCRERVCQYV